MGLALQCERVGIADAPEVEHGQLVCFGKQAHGARGAYGANGVSSKPRVSHAHRFPYNRAVPKIHPTAILDGDITIADDVEIGPYCILRGRITLGSGTVLVQTVHLQGPLTMGAGNVCYPGAAIGFAPQDKGFHHAKDGAGTVIGDGNTFREHSTVHRATRDDRPTRIGDRNLWMANAHAGHDVQVGHDCVFANDTLFGGHAEIGDRVVTGGGAGVHQFARIGRGAMISGLAGVAKDVCPFFTVSNTNYVGSYNRIGMRRGGFAPGDIEMVREIYGLLVRSRLPFSDRVRRIEALAGHPIADEFIAFIRSSKRGVMTRHGRASSARSAAAAAAGDE
jgi:UDP-N-acetylglucosamine acyltransferase